MESASSTCFLRRGLVGAGLKPAQVPVRFYSSSWQRWYPTSCRIRQRNYRLLHRPSSRPRKPCRSPDAPPCVYRQLGAIGSEGKRELGYNSRDYQVQEEGGGGGRKSYHFVVANAKFMLDEEEHFQELMSELLRLFGERNMEQDFWLVIEPKFLDKSPNITKRLKRPAVALVSTNGPWITYMKLRLDRVLQDSFEAGVLEEALASTPVDIEFEKPEKWTAPYAKYK